MVGQVASKPAVITSVVPNLDELEEFGAEGGVPQPEEKTKFGLLNVNAEIPALDFGGGGRRRYASRPLDGSSGGYTPGM